MPRPPPTKPTDAELAILQVLWDLGPSSVRTVHETLGRGGAYTSTLKLMQIMTAKGLVLRDESARSHIYRAATAKAETQKHLVHDLLDRAFNGSAQALILQALSGRRASPQELAEIQALLNEYRRSKGDPS